MNLIDKKITFDSFIRIIFTVIIIIGLVSLLDYLSNVLIPFTVALILAYILNPFVNFIQKFIRNRTLSVLMSLVIILAVLTSLGFVIIPMIIKELTHMGSLLKDLVNQTGLDEKIATYFPDGFSQYIKEFAQTEEVISFFNAEKISELINTAVEKVLPGVWGVFSGTVNFIIGFLGLSIILLYLIFLLIDYNEVISDWKKLIPITYQKIVFDLINDFELAMNNYFRAQALVAALVGVMFAVGFSIIGLPMGVLLGIFIGLLNMIPYLQIIGFIPATFFALIQSLETGTNFWVIMGFILIIFVVIQIIQDGFLVPKIMGNVTGLNPVAILLSLSIWGQLLGILGLLIALPLTYLLLSYYRRFLRNTFKAENKKQLENT